MDPNLALLTAVVFLPALGALVLAFIPAKQVEIVRYVTLVFTALVLLAVVGGFLMGGQTRFDTSAASMQSVFNQPWIPSFDIYYFMGIDGISFPLVLLTAFISLLAMGASWSIKEHVKAYCILFLLLETGMIGVFLALDLFLFYVFWEVMLLPMYFLIGVWGGPRRLYAAIKFFLYTLLGSVLMLIAILMLYFASDVRLLVDAERDGSLSAAGVQWEDLHISQDVAAAAGRSGARSDLGFTVETKDAGASVDLRFARGAAGAEKTVAEYDEAAGTVTVRLAEGRNTAADVVEAILASEEAAGQLRVELSEDRGAPRITPGDDDLALAPRPERPVHTFNILALQALGQHTDAFPRWLQWWAFILLFIGFAVKVPSVPVHTWLPDAHVEAPTPISMILAGVLLKMGGYGIIRICYPICPWGGFDLALFVCLIGVVSMVYGAFAAMAQKDFKRLVAYSSVSHMGYVVLGLGVWSALAGNNYDPQYWNMGVKGAMFQMIAHGISSAGMFFMVGVIYDRVHHRNLNEFGGLFGKMPVYTALSIGIFFAGLGLPGLCGFIGEVLVVLSVWEYSWALAIISASVVILTAAYILWALQRVYLGIEYKGPHPEALRRITPREFAIALPLFIFAIILGVFPHQTMLRYMDATIDRQTQNLANWTEREVPPPKQQRAANERAANDRAADAAPGDEQAAADRIAAERAALKLTSAPPQGEEPDP